MVRFAVACLACFGTWVAWSAVGIPNPNLLTVLGFAVSLKLGVGLVVGYLAWSRMD
jgi:hypothetical protein